MLANARSLLASSEPRSTLLRGKKLALLCEAEGPDSTLFREAAAELGAHVSHIRPRLADLQRTDDFESTARLLGRLYDAIECPGLSHDSVESVRRASEILVYVGLASERHATAGLAALLGKV